MFSLAKTLAKSAAKSAAKKGQNKATNYLDAKKRRIFESAKGAVFTNTSGGNKNYNPRAAYRNVPGSRVVTPL
jgi:hypothetical protein